MKKMMVTTMLAIGFLGVAPQAMAVGDDSANALRGASVEGLGDVRPCLGVPVKGNVPSMVGIVPIAVQDVPDLPVSQLPQCSENSTQFRAEEPLSQVMDQVPVGSGTGANKH
ncbi:RdlA protein [Streptomyces sp. S6]|nr:RdlA protein [Streptomyces sp. S6]